MKTTKLATLALSGLLALGSVVPAFAATINMGGDNIGTGAEYSAYKLMDLSTSQAGDSWNYRYTLNSKYTGILQGIVGEQDGVDGFDHRDVIKMLEGADAATTRKFADDVFAAIKADSSITADKTTTSNAFDVDQGYYLIVESKKGDSPDAYSLVMLDTAGQEDITVKTKEGVPTLTKTMLDGEEKYVGDRGLGDTVDFELKGTMPDNIDSYAKYKYIFHDKMSKGLELQADTIIVKIDGTTIDAGKYAVNHSNSDDCTFEVAFDDLKAAGVSISKDTVVTVEYKAKLTEAAVAGKAETNTAKLEFSNNPYNTDETDETPGDEDRVYTYKLVVNKVDGKENKPLAGANFKLQMKKDGEYVDLRTPEFEDGKTEFTFDHLDAGEYRLVETKVPDGYTEIDPIEFEITHVFGPEAAGGTAMVLKTLGSTNDDVHADTASGTLTTTVVNVAGSKLPSTGGAGTYAIYGTGIVCVVGGVALALSRKKKNQEEA